MTRSQASYKVAKNRLAKIAIEGTDGVGRSTQIQLLREWLEVKGFGVVETGWTRSPLMQPTIEIAKSSNTLNKLTFVLLYATDFADRLEKEIIPALKAGFVVLSDRYIFTALARAGVRGVDRQWLRNLYGFAIINQPQVGIVRMGELVKRPVVRSQGGEDAIVIRPLMHLALSYDHRAVDGAGANAFLFRIRERLEAGSFEL